ncbi:cytochrome P450 family protein [Streptomyces sp. NPDC005122]
MDPQPAARCPFALDFSGRDIHGEAAALQAQGPATQVDLGSGVVAWAITRPDLIRRLLTDDRISKDAHQHWPSWINGEVPTDWSLVTWVYIRNMLSAYGDDHARLRRPVAKAFTARRIAALEPRIKEIAEELLDAITAVPAGELVDLRETFAAPLPIQVISELFGVPSSPQLRDLVASLFRTNAGPEEAARTQTGLYAYLANVVAAKRNTPGEDLVSDLLAAQDEESGQGLSETELYDTLVLVISAGYETTANLICNAILGLLTHPDQLALVLSGEATWDDVISEALRWRAPVANLPLRYAVEDIVIEDGTVIAEGDAMIIGYAAAGRDPDVHGETADEFDITRPTRRDHLAFGHGTHYCLGAPLARLEAETALKALFQRFPGLTLAVPQGELQPIESLVSNGPRALPTLRLAAGIR